MMVVLSIERDTTVSKNERVMICQVRFKEEHLS